MCVVTIEVHCIIKTVTIDVCFSFLQEIDTLLFANIRLGFDDAIVLVWVGYLLASRRLLAAQWSLFQLRSAWHSRSHDIADLMGPNSSHKNHQNDPA